MKTMKNLLMIIMTMTVAMSAKAFTVEAPVVDETQQSSATVTVTGNSVHLRYGPGLEYDFLKWANGTSRCPKKGERLPLLGESGDWYLVSYAGKQLYLFKTYGKVNGSTAAASAYKVQITGTGVRLRFGPGLDYGYLVWENGAARSPKKGERLTYLGQSGDWYKVRYAGADVYVFKSYGKLVK